MPKNHDSCEAIPECFHCTRRVLQNCRCLTAETTCLNLISPAFHQEDQLYIAAPWVHGGNDSKDSFQHWVLCTGKFVAKIAYKRCCKVVKDGGETEPGRGVTTLSQTIQR